MQKMTLNPGWLSWLSLVLSQFCEHPSLLLFSEVCPKRQRVSIHFDQAFQGNPWELTMIDFSSKFTMSGSFNLPEMFRMASQAPPFQGPTAASRRRSRLSAKDASERNGAPSPLATRRTLRLQLCDPHAQGIQLDLAPESHAARKRMSWPVRGDLQCQTHHVALHNAFAKSQPGCVATNPNQSSRPGIHPSIPLGDGVSDRALSVRAGFSASDGPACSLRPKLMSLKLGK